MAKAGKKTATEKSRVSPIVPVDDTIHIKYEDLANGDCFLWKGHLMMKWDFEDQEAIDLDSGEKQDYLCEEIVIPVDIKIAWKRK